jgi:hypothetical protein
MSQVVRTGPSDYDAHYPICLSFASLTVALWLALERWVSGYINNIGLYHFSVWFTCPSVVDGQPVLPPKLMQFVNRQIFWYTFCLYLNNLIYLALPLSLCFVAFFVLIVVLRSLGLCQWPLPVEISTRIIIATTKNPFNKPWRPTG